MGIAFFIIAIVAAHSDTPECGGSAEIAKICSSSFSFFSLFVVAVVRR